ncbi:MAG TPA: transporter, partial [Anaeromyxobacteraceae bacterium]|nr:transporter [Anaeromyxobacteraceae bacterium]
PAYGATVIASQAIGRFGLHANLGWSHADYALEADRAANHRDVFHASLAATAQVLPRLVLAANVGAETNPDRASDTAPAFAVAGAIWSVTDALDLDLGVKAGLSAPEADLAMLGGVAFRF